MQSIGYEQYLNAEERIALGEADYQVALLMQRAPRGGGRGCHRRWDRRIARASLVASEIIARAQAREEAEIRSFSAQEARRRVERMRQEAEERRRVQEVAVRARRDEELKHRGLRVCPKCDRETGRSNAYCAYCSAYVGFAY